MKPSRRTPTAKATKCWANVYDHQMRIYDDQSEACLNKTFDDGVIRTVPAFLLTQEQVEACVEAMAIGIAKCWKNSIPDPVWKLEARAALKAIGITSKRRAGK